jgi:hypothetical protein
MGGEVPTLLCGSRRKQLTSWQNGGSRGYLPCLQGQLLILWDGRGQVCACPWGMSLRASGRTRTMLV